jgi:hypothetical protein
MDRNNIIDMSSHFINIRNAAAMHAAKPSLTAKCLHVLGRILETSAAIVTALCVCVCTLLFFTML